MTVPPESCPHLATAELWGNWNSSNYHLFLNLACGAESITGGPRSYEANLKQCLVNVYALNSAINLSDPYFSVEGLNKTGPNGYSSKLDVVESSETQTKRQGEVEFVAAGVAKPGWISRLHAKVRFWGSRGEERRAKSKRSTSIQQVLSIVTYSGDGWWKVGDDDHGDPRYGGWLRGIYFRENPTKPLCTVHSARRRAEVRVLVCAERNKIYIDEMDADGRPKRLARGGRRAEALETLSARAILRGFAVAKRRLDVFYEQAPWPDVTAPSLRELIPLHGVILTLPLKEDTTATKLGAG